MKLRTRELLASHRGCSSELASFAHHIGMKLRTRELRPSYRDVAPNSRASAVASAMKLRSLCTHYNNKFLYSDSICVHRDRSFAFGSLVHG
jgi:hypothetical protein